MESPARRYAVDPVKVERVFDKIPLHQRRRINVIKESIKTGLAILEDRGDPDPVGTLIDRIEAYVNSDEGRSRFTRAIYNWLDDGGYDEPEEAWERRQDRDGPPCRTNPITGEPM